MTDEEKSPLRGNAAPAGTGASLAQAIGARNLMIVIITMPLVFLIVVMATIAIFGRPGAGEEAAAPSERVVAALDTPVLAQPEAAGVTRSSAVSLSQEAATPLILPPGADITSMSLDGGRIALRIDSEEGGEIVIYDLETGAAMTRIPVKRQVAAGEEL